MVRTAAITCAVAVLVSAPGAAFADDLPARFEMGTSVKGRPIVAERQGPADAEHVLLVIGQMHGDEPYGRYVVDKLRGLTPRADTAIWTIRTMNPDGEQKGTRRNADGVDLNRNFPDRWQPSSRSSLYYSGPKVGSEPETQAVIDGIERIHPDAIVSFHQRANLVDRPSAKKAFPWARRLSRDLNLPVKNVPCVTTKCAGTLAGWFNNNFAGWAVTVELPSRIGPARQRSMARAMRDLAPDLKPTQQRGEPAP